MCMKLFHTRYEGEKEGQPPSHVVTERTQGHSLDPPNAKELHGHVCHGELVSSEEGEGRVQWTGMKCRVRCGTCEVLLGVGSHVRHGKVSINCYIS